MKSGQDLVRCEWCLDNDLYIKYHDEEWGIPLHDDVKLFELLCLEGAQAGLSWLTVLKKREAYRRAFEGFDLGKVSKFDEKKISQLLNNEGIIRNRQKIHSVIANAKATIEVQRSFGSFNEYLWQFVNKRPIQNKYNEVRDLPSSDEIAIKMSKDLKNRNYNFVGPTICYAFMQSAGLVNDHLTTCFRYKQLMPQS